MATIHVRVPEETHVVICRGRDAVGADHEIISTRDLQVFLEAHVLRHLKARFGPVAFVWTGLESWRSFLQGEAIRIIVFPERSSHLNGHYVIIQRRDDPREMMIK